MSGVYIKGMEMPKDRPLIIKINPDGTVSSTFRNDYRKYEAFAVPDHGRLKDVDALIALHRARAKKAGGVSGLISYMAAEVLDVAPTIIPADKEADK